MNTWLALITPARVGIGALIVLVLVQSWRLNSLQVDYAEQAGSLALAQSDLRGVGEQLKAQNAGIAALEAAGKAREEAAVKAQARAERIADAAVDRALRIQNAQIPTDCKAAVEWLARQGQIQSHGWK